MEPLLDVDVTHARGLDPYIEVDESTLRDWAIEELKAGRCGYPLGGDEIDALQAWVEQAPAADDIVLCGIGGSALSARVFDALREPQDQGPRLHVIDTVDPGLVEHLLRTLDPARTIVLAVSKSGSTLETVTTFLLFETWLHDALGRGAAARVVVVAGEAANPLRARAEERGYACFAIPAAVGGRYSGLTPAGMLPAACVGVSPGGLRGGAMVASENAPVLLLAGIHHAAYRAGRSTIVLLPYGERLRALGPWWAQLLAESLGKPGPDRPVGVTPVAASGPADQHSLLQLLVEGPDDKLVVFVHADGPDGPVVPAGPPGLDTAAGRPLRAVLDAERLGTEFALAQAGRPSLCIRLAAADAPSVGAFLFTYQMATVLWARMLGVDPFGQPGVELGKRAARARLTGEPTDLAKAIDEHEQRSR